MSPREDPDPEILRKVTEELVHVIEMESSGRVLNLSVQDRAARWAIGIARRLTPDERRCCTEPLPGCINCGMEDDPS